MFVALLINNALIKRVILVLFGVAATPWPPAALAGSVRPLYTVAHQ